MRFLLFLTTINAHFIGVSQIPSILEANNRDVKIEKVTILNSSLRETNVSITPNGAYIFYMTTRGHSDWSQSNYGTFKDQPEFDSDIWFSKSNNDNWMPPVPLNRPANSPRNEDEPVISQDGQQVYYQSWANGWRENGGPYYMSKLDGWIWKNRVGLGGGITKFFNDSLTKHLRYGTDGMSLSADKQTFFVAAGKDYDSGNFDLLYSRYKNNEWSYLKKHPLSTTKNERTIYISTDGQTVYFASDGYGGQGGLDIFKAKLSTDGSITQIVNIGPPFNTEYDDYGFIISNRGREAYFVRDGDIYHADLSEADELMLPEKEHWITGKITDLNQNPVGCELTILLDNEVHTSVFSNATDGTFFFTLPPDAKNLTISTDYKSVDYTLGSDNFDHEINIKTTSQPHHVVHFDYDRSDISQKEEELLTSFLSHIQLHEKARILLIGHTDIRGNASYNSQLSKNRAQQVKSFFKKKGISNSIEIQYYGKTQPLNTSSNETEHSNNRRVEIILL